MSETRLKKYENYRQSVNEYKAITKDPEVIKDRDINIITERMNTTSTLPLEDVLGKIEETPEPVSQPVMTRKMITIGAITLAGLLLVAGIIIFAIYAFGGK